MTLHRDYLHVVGQEGYYKYSLSSRSWEIVYSGSLPGETVSPGSLPREIVSRYHSVVQDGGLVYLVGGRSPGVRHLNGVRSVEPDLLAARFLMNDELSNEET